MTSFKEDLRKEKILSSFLDTIYARLNLEFVRITDREKQYRGIDLLYSSNEIDTTIDEKAQLHYLNKDLPTFTFELSYRRNGKINKGWLYDDKKYTDYYFLITGIFVKNNVLQSSDDIETCKITSVSRKRLLHHLNQLGLTQAKLEFYDQELRENGQFGKHVIEEIGAEYGSLHFTEHLSEQPINLKLQLDYLLRMNIGKRLFPID